MQSEKPMNVPKPPVRCNFQAIASDWQASLPANHREDECIQNGEVRRGVPRADIASSDA
jgi:hypothetical protein